MPRHNRQILEEQISVIQDDEQTQRKQRLFSKNIKIVVKWEKKKDERPREPDGTPIVHDCDKEHCTRTEEKSSKTLTIKKAQKTVTEAKDERIRLYLRTRRGKSPRRRFRSRKEKEHRSEVEEIGCNRRRQIGWWVSSTGKRTRFVSNPRFLPSLNKVGSTNNPRIRLVVVLESSKDQGRLGWRVGLGFCFRSNWIFHVRPVELDIPRPFGPFSNYIYEHSNGRSWRWCNKPSWSSRIDRPGPGRGDHNKPSCLGRRPGQWVTCPLFFCLPRERRCCRWFLPEEKDARGQLTLSAMATQLKNLLLKVPGRKIRWHGRVSQACIRTIKTRETTTVAWTTYD